MAIERIAEELAKLEGYLTVTRVPYSTGESNSDLDVVGFRPYENRVLLIECKAWGKPEEYKDRGTERRIAKVVAIGSDLIQGWQKFVAGPTNYWHFKKGDLAEIRIIVPGHIEQKPRDELVRRLRQVVPAGVEVSVIMIHEMLLKVFEVVKTDMKVRRKRYPDSAFEMARWLIRSKDHHNLNV